MNRPFGRGLLATTICGLTAALALVAWLEHRPVDPNAAARRARMQRPDSPLMERSSGDTLRDLLAEAENTPEGFGSALTSPEGVRPDDTPPQMVLPDPVERPGPMLEVLRVTLPVAMIDSAAPIVEGEPEPRIFVRGNTRADEAVHAAHQWVAAHQLPGGRWSFQVGEGHLRSDTAATALAVLAFQGTGNTHKQGRYKKNVDSGLQWLLKHMDQNTGQMMGPGENMLAHGLATIALCEALAVTEDRSLRPHCENAVAFIVGAQDRANGGWGWQPGEHGYMPATAWQILALKSARIAGLKVPRDTFAASRRFIDRCETASGIFARQPDGRPAADADATAMGLLCRVYLDGPHAPRLQAGLAWLWDDSIRAELSLQGLFCHQLLNGQVGGGAPWSRHRDLSAPFVRRQERLGHAAGSWTPRTREEHVGGRLYTTAMIALTLSAYYRHLPITSQEAASDDR